MKILWCGDHGATTGFATVTHAITSRLVAKGHEVSVLGANYRGEDGIPGVRGFVPTLLVPTDTYGYSRIVEVLSKVEPDVVVILNDPFIMLTMLMENPWDSEKVLLRYRPLITYQPRDGLNGPKTWDIIPKISRAVAYCEFGQEQIPGSEVIYHGIDTETFHPASSDRPIVTSQGQKITNKRDAKRVFGYDPEGFLVLRVDRNSGRKDFASTWKALLPSMHKHADIEVHFHCQGNDKSGGPSMPDLFTRDPETFDRFHLPKDYNTFQGWPPEDLVALYNAADLFITTSQGEGWGLTIGEATACGVPVVAQNFSAIPEVVGPGGILIEPGYEVTAPGGQDMMAADVPAFSAAIERLYNNRGERRKLGVAGVKHAKTFSWDTAADGFERIALELHEGIPARDQ